MNYGYTTLAGSLHYNSTLNALTLESGEEGIFAEHFGMPLDRLKAIVQGGRGKLADDLWRKLQAGLEEIPRVRGKIWRDAARELVPLGFGLAETGDPWKRALRPASPEDAPQPPMFHAVVEMEAGGVDETMIRAGLSPGAYRPLDQLARRMFGAGMEDIARAVNGRLEEEAALPLVREDTEAWDIEQKMDLMAVAQRHFLWEDGRAVDVLFDRDLNVWEDIMMLHPGLVRRNGEEE